jgi:hypothetical protein
VILILAPESLQHFTDTFDSFLFHVTLSTPISGLLIQKALSKSIKHLVMYLSATFAGLRLDLKLPVQIGYGCLTPCLKDVNGYNEMMSMRLK